MPAAGRLRRAPPSQIQITFTRRAKDQFSKGERRGGWGRSAVLRAGAAASRGGLRDGRAAASLPLPAAAGRGLRAAGCGGAPSGCGGARRPGGGPGPSGGPRPRGREPAAEVARPPRPAAAASGRGRSRGGARPGLRGSPPAPPPGLCASEPGVAGRRRLPPEENGRGEVPRRRRAGPGRGGGERHAGSHRLRASAREIRRLPAGARRRAAAARRSR